MSAFLGLIGTAGIIVSIVLMILGRVTKKKKHGLTVFLISLVFFIAGLAIPSNNTGEKATDKKTVKNVSTAPKENAEKKEASKQIKDKVATATTAEESTPKKEANKTNENIGESTVAALESNDFMKFVNEYKKLGGNKTAVWDKQIYGKKVTWTGTVEHAGTSEVFVYGNDDYNGETWGELGDKKKLFYCFVAKYKDPSQFKNIKQGEKITVRGNLTSRGDYDLNYNWKIYNAVLVK